MDLSIIIVSYNTKDFLKKCLESVVSTTKNLSYEVIIVDNASTDATVEEIQSFWRSQISLHKTNFKLIENRENVGFAKANNLGLKMAKGKYILFLNPDTIICPETLEIMVKFMKNHLGVGAATCRVDLTNRKLDDACHRGFPTPWNSFCYFSGLSTIFPKSKIFAGYSMGFMDLSKPHEIDACAGAFMLVKREAGEQIGWWDEDYFFYGEDLDFCYRLKQKGWKIFYVPEVSILHYKGVSGGIKKMSKHLTTADEETKKRATKARFDAMEIFYKKHYKGKYPFLINWFTQQGIKLKRVFS